MLRPALPPFAFILFFRDRSIDLKPLITLLAIVNPLAIVPFFIHYTQGFSAAQRRGAVRTAALPRSA